MNTLDLNFPLETDLASNIESVENRLLEGLQGNILTPHKKRFARHIFFSIGHRSQGIAYLRYLQTLTTTAQMQLSDDGAGPFVFLYLSESGYTQLGIPPEDTPSDAAFRDGMKTRSPLWLKDPSPANWESTYQRRLDLLVLVAADNETDLRTHCERLLSQCPQRVELAVDEGGEVIRDSQGRPIEHFGFVDGISGPVFLKSDSRRPKPGRDLTALRLVLAKCPASGPAAYGSYLVYRKLEQNVYEFHRMVREELSPMLNSGGTDRNEYAAALLMGRFRDGTPLAVHRGPGYPNSNSFDFLSDQSGSRCPISAHIRKVNPRGTGDQNERLSRRLESQHVIARRSIPYPFGSSSAAHLNPACALADLPKTGVGILFMCFQSSISDQFEFIQREWANDRFFPPHLRDLTASDAVVSTSGKRANSWPRAWDSNDRVSFTPRKTIHFKGGEYFFAPSMAFFSRLVD